MICEDWPSLPPMWGDKVKMPSHGVDALRTCWLLKEAADRALLLLRVRASSWALLLCVYQLSTLLQALDDPLVVDCGKQLWSTERVLAALRRTVAFSTTFSAPCSSKPVSLAP